MCGDGACTHTETSASCPDDCGAPPGWVQRITDHAPGCMSNAITAFDSARGVTVFYSNGHTWEFDGRDWCEITTPTPVIDLYNPEMSYDSTR
ncbi:MAG: hypothetical protein KKE89_02335, partial [Actinobacteria bacterium]|nr:hypothetical protein [Actinomycetota bacterium]